MAARLLTKFEIVRMHRSLLREYGGESGGPRRHALDNVMEAVAAAEEHGILAAAATFAAQVVRVQPFTDANHRVASRGVGVMLRLNGRTFGADRRDAFYEMIWRVPGDPSVDEEFLRSYLESNTVPLPAPGGD